MRISDWSSDVCSSDLRCQRIQSTNARPLRAARPARKGARFHPRKADRKSVVEGKSVSVRVDLGGSRIIKKKKRKIKIDNRTYRQETNNNIDNKNDKQYNHKEVTRKTIHKIKMA